MNPLDLLPPDLAARSFSDDEIVLPLEGALLAIDILESKGAFILGWEGWVRDEHGLLGFDDRFQGTTSLDSIPAAEAAEFCRRTIVEAAAEWERDEPGSTSELGFCVTVEEPPSDEGRPAAGVETDVAATPKLTRRTAVLPVGERWPAFSDPFLESVSRGFERRRKALRGRGRFEAFAPALGDDFEWLTLSNRLASPRRAVVLQLLEGHLAHLYVRHSGNRDRGKMLARFEFMRLFPNADAIVAAYEGTLLDAFAVSRAEDLSIALEDRWRPVRAALRES